MKSKDFTTLFSLKRNDFISVIKEENDDYYRYCMLRDEILLNNSNYQQHKPCIACHKFGHKIEICPLIHYIPNKEQIIKIHSKKDLLQIRTVFLRQRTKKTNALRTNKENFVRLCKYLRDSSKSFNDDDYDNDEIQMEIEEEDTIQRLLLDRNRIKSSSSNMSISIPSVKNNTSKTNEKYITVENFENIKSFKTYYPHYNFSVDGFNYLVAKSRELDLKGRTMTLMIDSKKEKEKGKKMKVTQMKKNFYSSRLELKEKVSLYELVKLVMEQPKIKKQLRKKS